MADDVAEQACERALDAKGYIGISTRAIYRDGWMAALAWHAARPAPAAELSDDSLRAFVARIATTRCDHDDETCERWIHEARALMAYAARPTPRADNAALRERAERAEREVASLNDYAAAVQVDRNWATERAERLAGLLREASEALDAVVDDPRDPAVRKLLRQMRAEVSGEGHS